MNAVCTILGWWTAAAAAAGGAGIIEAAFAAASVGDEFLDDEAVPFISASGLLLEAEGVVAFVGVVISMGSPGDGADIWMVGVGMGTIRVLICSPGPSVARSVLCGLSVAVAIFAVAKAEGRSARQSRRGQDDRGGQLDEEMGMGGWKSAGRGRYRITAWKNDFGGRLTGVPHRFGSRAWGMR